MSHLENFKYIIQILKFHPSGDRAVLIFVTSLTRNDVSAYENVTSEA
jgi:hypothetical protein